MTRIVGSRLVVGLEVHVELGTRTRMFSRAVNTARREGRRAGAAAADEPNSLLDPLVLALPGSLPVLNRGAIELAMMVGMALGCEIPPVCRWDRKSYFYPDMPKGYQISQYQMPLCAAGAVDVESEEAGKGGEGGGVRRIRITRAHLEEDAGKLLHEAPGGAPIDHSIVDLNRAGTPLLEIVTEPDFSSADQVVAFARDLRTLCRFLGASECVLQEGQMRFEPNINCVLALEDGREIRTPIVEVKNLNSFRALRGAVEFEAREQGPRWQTDGRQAGPGSKRTLGWDDQRQCTVPRREKEDAHDYRYFPDPDLLPLQVDPAWRESVRARIPELPAARRRRYQAEFGLGVGECAMITQERDLCFFFETATAEAARRGVAPARAGRLSANFILQSGLKRSNERAGDVGPHELGITAHQVGALAALRDKGEISASAADELFGLLADSADPDSDPRALAGRRSMLLSADPSSMAAWCDAAIAANPQAAQDVRAGKPAAIGRLVGAVIKLSGAAADGNAARAALLEKLAGG